MYSRVLKDTKEDVEELQRDLIRLESWSSDWQLKINTAEESLKFLK